MAEVKPAIESFAKIKVIGVGGSGGSAINRMIKSKIKGVEFLVANTDVQALHNSQATKKIQLGKSVTRGLGAGMNPDVGKQSAEESANEIREALNGADMVFITCGLGGGTGSGASPVIADIARECGALTVAVVTKPFGFEGVQRRNIAENAYNALASQVDTIIVIPNDRVLTVADKKTTLVDAFEAVDDVLRQGVQSISEVITIPGLVNVDFADVKSVMSNTGSALMGIGMATGENRVITAAKQAISSPLLELSIDGAKGILFTITGNSSLSMQEFAEAAQVITNTADSEAKVIFGTVIDDSMQDEVKVCVIATGFDGQRRNDPPTAAQPSFHAAERFSKKIEPEQEPEPEQPQKKESVSVREQRFHDDHADTDRDDVDGISAFIRKPLTERKEVKMDRRPEPAAMATADDAEDLEIPAFIRRKLP
ncbi:MAG: cell division protein FtsZ [Patescibacteria group bacterium]